MRDKLHNIARRIQLFRDWYKVVFPGNRLVSRQQTLQLRSGVVVTVGDIFSSDLSFLQEIFAQDAYHLKDLVLPEHPVVVDIGANIGSFSLAIKQYFPGTHLVAIEPFARNFDLLVANVPSARCIQVAVGGMRSQMRMSNNATPTMFQFVEQGGSLVDVITLADALAGLPRVDLLKVDIEGAEYDVFAHTPDDVFQKIRSILVEIHAPHDPAYFVELFERQGLTVSWVSPSIMLAQRSHVSAVRSTCTGVQTK